MTHRNLGEEMNVAVFAVLEKLTEAGAHRLLKMVIQKSGMTPVLRPAVWNYPVFGMGGIGETIAHPAAIAQPLAESLSMVITDSWHEHQGFFLILCSCRPFDSDKIRDFLIRRGWNVVGKASCEVDLIPPKKSLWRKIVGVFEGTQ